VPQWGSVSLPVLAGLPEPCSPQTMPNNPQDLVLLHVGHWGYKRLRQGQRCRTLPLALLPSIAAALARGADLCCDCWPEDRLQMCAAAAEALAAEAPTRSSQRGATPSAAAASGAAPSALRGALAEGSQASVVPLALPERATDRQGALCNVQGAMT
jgi:hypothetical protein